MIILHNSHSKQSRDFVEKYKDKKPTVYDWYFGGQAEWYKAGGTDKVQDFPSIVVDVPEHIVPVNEENSSPEIHVKKEQVAVHVQNDINDVNNFIDKMNKNIELSNKNTSTHGISAEPIKKFS